MKAYRLGNKSYTRKEFYKLLLGRNQRRELSKCRKIFRKSWEGRKVGSGGWPIYAMPNGRVFAVDIDI